MGRRGYAGGANTVQLTSPIDDAALVLNVSSLVGWPSSGAPFAVVINRGNPSEEKVLCNGLSAGVLTVAQRGYDGTTKLAHGATETVEHTDTAVDADEANAHVNQSDGVHGLAAGNRVLGRSETATVSGKSLDGLANTFTNIPLASSPETQTQIGTLTAANAAQDTAIADRYTKSEVDTFFVTSNSTHYTKTEADAAIATEASLRADADNLRYLKTETYTQAQVDTIAATKVTETDLAFQSYTPTIAGTTSGGSLGSGDIQGRWNEIGTRVFFEISLTLGTTSFGVGNLTLSLPVAAASANWPHCGTFHATDISAGARYTGVCEMDNTSRFVLSFTGTPGIINGSSPFAWASGDVLRVQGSYEASS